MIEAKEFDEKVRAKVGSITEQLVDRGLSIRQIEDFWVGCIREVTNEKQFRIF